MRTNEERLALKEFGYTEHEATFLCLAALHSGFFLRRQYREFLGKQAGYRDDLLVRKIETLGHGRPLTSSRSSIIYHLCSRPFYNAIGEPDNRHRRLRPPFAVKAKLMALDYVLSNPGLRFLATECEKVTYFTGQLGIAKDRLPSKIYRSRATESKTVRYFVDKFPVAISSNSSSTPPVVSFCYVDEGVVATPGFEAWLGQYSKLFSSLRSFRVVYIACDEKHIQTAATLFHRFFDSEKPGKPDLASRSERLFSYFRLEQLYRSGRFEELDAKKLDELRHLRKEFSGQEIESLYELWTKHGAPSVVAILDREKGVDPPSDADFVPYKLDWNYNLFGA